MKTTETTEHGTGADGKATNGSKTVVESEEKAANPDESLLGRSLDSDVTVYLIRLGIALLAGFLAGLIVQRIGLGKYGVTLPFGFGFAELTEEKTNVVEAKLAKDPVLRKAVDKAPEVPLAETEVADDRAQVALVREEVEQALRGAGKEVEQVDESAPLRRLITEFADVYGLNENGRGAIEEVISLGDQAAHGARIGPGVGRWFAEEGQRLANAIANMPPPSR